MGWGAGLQMEIHAASVRREQHTRPALAEDTGVPAAFRSARLDQLAAADASSADLANRLLSVAVHSLPRAFRDREFAFRLDGAREQDGSWRLTPSGKSQRYAAITALGLLRLPVQAQRSVLAGECCSALVARLTGCLDHITSLGDAALTCWAAAECSHDTLPRALSRLAQLDDPERPAHVVDAAWTVSALVAARSVTNVEEHLELAGRRLINARRGALFPPQTNGGGTWYRSHIGSFADQVYPLQALARLHASADDKNALAAANDVAGVICAAQGKSGQWWWHYDSRSGGVVEEYPVYSVHQHAMGPMALMDLADVGGDEHMDAICRGLRWLAGPPETREALVLEDPPTTWRKVARGDRGKLVRGLRATATRVRPQWRLPALDRVFPPGAVDHECRPYELGWLLYSWLSGGAQMSSPLLADTYPG
jgi:hypothetical protein